MNDPGNSASPAKFTEIDRLIHEPARLAVMALLFVIESADFTFIMNQTALSWGNLSTHLTKLEEAGYIEVEKSFKGKRPNTHIRLTPAGRKAFQEYRSNLKQMLDELPV
jgi:DNA-binding MarR family transcriptional regulator